MAMAIHSKKPAEGYAPALSTELEGGAHILLIDDDSEVRDLVSRFLRKHDYRVTTARNGVELRDAIGLGTIDLIVLDLMLPGEDGLSLCRSVRATSRVPIIMLTAMADDTDRILGLEMGADGYLTKPFNSRELLARIKAVLRRTASGPFDPLPGSRTLGFSGWRLDTVRRELSSPDGIAVDLSTGEYELLIALAQHSRRVLTREQLLDIAKGRSATPFDRSIDVQISRLRRKLDRDGDEHEGDTFIKTVRGVGYLFTPLVTWV